MFNEMKYNNALEQLNKLFKYEECKYFNMCIASGIAQGRKVGEDEIRNMLLGQFELGFITYDQEVALNNLYNDNIAAIEALQEA